MWNDKKSGLVLVYAQHYVESLTHASADIALISSIRKLNSWMFGMAELGRWLCSGSRVTRNLVMWMYDVMPPTAHLTTSQLLFLSRPPPHSARSHYAVLCPLLLIGLMLSATHTKPLPLLLLPRHPPPC
jgi:hypothetical protein